MEVGWPVFRASLFSGPPRLMQSGPYIDVNSTVTLGYIQIFHRDTLDCFIEIHLSVASDFSKSCVMYLQCILC